MSEPRSWKHRVLEALSALGATALGAAMAVAFFGAVAASGPEPAEAFELECECPCFGSLLSKKAGLGSPVICYDNPGGATNTFAYFPPPDNLFVQVTDFWCRANGAFAWMNPDQRNACRAHVLSACGANVKAPACEP